MFMPVEAVVLGTGDKIIVIQKQEGGYVMMARTAQVVLVR